jgi:hypothetical protein
MAMSAAGGGSLSFDREATVLRWLAEDGGLVTLWREDLDPSAPVDVGLTVPPRADGIQATEVGEAYGVSMSLDATVPIVDRLSKRAARLQFSDAQQANELWRASTVA